MLFLNESGKINTSTEGWMMCLEENCNCFQTWSTDFKTNDKLDNKKKGNRLELAFKKLFK
jgi:hypothetical protein